MQYFRRVVGEKYSDFQARLPDCRPSMLFALALSEDGTTEESRYPNLMLAEVRGRYGL